VIFAFSTCICDHGCRIWCHPAEEDCVYVRYDFTNLLPRKSDVVVYHFTRTSRKKCFIVQMFSRLYENQL